MLDQEAKPRPRGPLDDSFELGYLPDGFDEYIQYAAWHKAGG